MTMQILYTSQSEKYTEQNAFFIFDKTGLSQDVSVSFTCTNNLCSTQMKPKNRQQEMKKYKWRRSGLRKQKKICQSHLRSDSASVWMIRSAWGLGIY